MPVFFGECASSEGGKIGFAHLVRSREAAAKPRNRAHGGTLSYFCCHLFASKLAMGGNKKTIATVVTTVSRLGGEDKIRTCGRVTPTAV